VAAEPPACPASQDPWQRNLVSVTLQLGLAPCVDMAELLLSADDQAPSVAIGDTGTVSLGYEDSSTDLVFTGQVESLRRSAHGTLRLAAGNGGAPLSRLRLNQSYEQQAAGDVVGELAGRAGVGTDTVEDGVDLPFYVLDDRRSAYEHIAALARKSGYLAYFTPEGKLNFKPFAAGRPVQTFAYGQDILALEVLLYVLEERLV